MVAQTLSHRLRDFLEVGIWWLGGERFIVCRAGSSRVAALILSW